MKKMAVMADGMSARVKMSCAALAVAALGIVPASWADEPAKEYRPGSVRVHWSEKEGETWVVEGLADRESGRPMARDTVFAICSNTKPITSVLALTFVEEGLINLDDPVSKYLPEFADIKYKGRPPKRPIILRHLLTHLSGLPYSAHAEGRKSDMLSYQEQVKFALEKGLRSEPGEKYQYCGLGFQVMGAVLEKVTGRKVTDLMKERIFDPLGMTESTFYPSAQMLERLAVPYYYPLKGGAPVRYDISNRWTPPMDNTARTAMLSGGLFCTVGDYLKFSQLIALKGVGANGKRILSEKTVNDYLLTRQTPLGDKVDSSFDIGFNKNHTGGGKGGLFATSAKWNWAERSCSVNFRAKSPYPPKGMKAAIDASGFGGKKTSFVVSEEKVSGGKASCRVGNNEDRHGVATVSLVVNGKVVDSKRVELAIGESKSVEFAHEAKPGDRVTFKIAP